ncbi:preprotein translocase subunit YajC [Tundrisphaera sp. TA3]|uniref:preprotein translocase subunit YajC n=1 Tax=Tundrisphaera sp. TA3 TaxID=3435775 RepID=UPI003EBD1590
MFGPFDAVPLLFAQAAAQQPSPFSTLIPLLPIPILFYLLMYRPQQQQERRRKDMIRALKPNDKVLTAAGIYGTVQSVDPANDRIVLRVDGDGRVKIPFTMSSVVRLLEPSDKPETARDV